MVRPDAVEKTYLSVRYGQPGDNPHLPWGWTAHVRAGTSLQTFHTIISLPYTGNANDGPPSADPGPFRALREALLRSLPGAVLNGEPVGKFERALQRVWAGGGAYGEPAVDGDGQVRARVHARDPRGAPLPGERWHAARVGPLKDEQDRDVGFVVRAHRAGPMARVELRADEKVVLDGGADGQRVDCGMKLDEQEILALCALLRGLAPDAPAEARTHAVGTARRLLRDHPRARVVDCDLDAE